MSQYIQLGPNPFKDPEETDDGTIRSAEFTIHGGEYPVRCVVALVTDRQNGTPGSLHIVLGPTDQGLADLTKELVLHGGAADALMDLVSRAYLALSDLRRSRLHE